MSCAERVTALPRPESDSAWLKRTVEELTTARPVEVTEYNSSVGYSTFRVASLGQRSLCLAGSVEKRDTDAVLRSLTDHRWPLRNAKPAEPSPQPSELEALTRRVEELTSRVYSLEVSRAEQALDALREREERERGTKPRKK